MRRWQVTIRRYANYPADGDVTAVFDTWAEARDLMVADLRRFERDYETPGLAAVIPHFLTQLTALKDGDHHYFTVTCGQYELGDELRDDGTPAYPAGEERDVTARRRTWDGRPGVPTVWVDPDCWARGAFQALAVTLAEPLRKAFREHLDEHGCGCPGDRWCEDRERHEANGGHAVPGIGHCPEGSRLFRLLPEFDRVIVAYAVGGAG